MPSGEEDVTPSLDSSPSETNPSTQVPTEPQGEGGADAGPQPEIDAAPPADGAAANGDTNPDPVQEAIAKLAKPDKGAPPASGTSQPGKTSPKASAPTKSAPAEPQEKPAGEAAKPEGAPKEKTGPTLDDPYAGWLPTEQAKALLKPQTRQRIEEIHHKWKEAENHPTRQLGEDFQSMLTSHKLDDDIGFVPPDHLAGLVRAQAAINRGLLALEQGRRPAGTDLDVLKNLTQQVTSLGSKLGLPAAQTGPTMPTPFQGTLEPDYQDLIDVFHLPEARVRLLAALEKSSKGAPAERQDASPLPTQQPPAQQRDERPEGVDMESLFARQVAGTLAKDGVTADRFNAYVKALEPTMKQMVRAEFPGLKDGEVVEVFNAMSAKERANITIQAHAAYRAAQQSPPPVRTPPPPPTRQPTQGQPMKRGAPAHSDDPVVSAIALLARSDDQ